MSVSLSRRRQSPWHGFWEGGRENEQANAGQPGFAETPALRKRRSRRLKPLKEDVDANESTAIASFLREAHNLNSQRAIMEAFVGPVIAHLGKNLLSDLWDGDVDDMTVDEVKAMNVSLLRRFLRAKNSAVYAADARRRAATAPLRTSALRAHNKRV